VERDGLMIPFIGVDAFLRNRDASGCDQDRVNYSSPNVAADTEAMPGSVTSASARASCDGGNCGCG
jgi:hypothetical protein